MVWTPHLGALALLALSGGVSAGGWSGCYIGAQAGGLRSAADNWTVPTPGAPHAGESLGSHTANGAQGGAQAGCDVEVANGVVVGIVGDFVGADAEGSHDSAQERGVSYHSSVRSLATVALRVGYAWDRWLAYVKGGAAWQRDRYWANQTILGTAYKSTETQSGWTVGIGAEHAFAPALSGFIEYGYSNYGTQTISFAPQVAGLPTAFVDITQRTSVVRVGISYRFGT